MQDPKNRQKVAIWAPSHNFVGLYLRKEGRYRQSEKNSNTSSTCPRNMVNFSPLAAEIGSGVWGTPANFNGFHVLAALLHGTVAVGVTQTLRRWTEGATYIRQGGHHVGHWPTFLVIIMGSPYGIGQPIIFLPCGFFFLSFFLSFFPRLIAAVADWMSVILPHIEVRNNCQKAKYIVIAPFFFTYQNLTGRVW